MTDHQAIRDALAVGPCDGPWSDGGGYGVHRADGIGILSATTPSGAMRNHAANTRYVAACNPAAITELLARLDAAEAVVNAARIAMDCSEDSLNHISLQSHHAASLSLCLDDFDSAMQEVKP